MDSPDVSAFLAIEVLDAACNLPAMGTYLEHEKPRQMSVRMLVTRLGWSGVVHSTKLQVKLC